MGCITSKEVAVVEPSSSKQQLTATESYKQHSQNHYHDEVPGGTDKDILVVEVPDADKLKDGEMQEVEIGLGKALLVKTGGNFYAVGGKCTHYGAPLAKGSLSGNHVRCPWHGACFNIKTGDIEDFPGLDSLPCYKVSAAYGKVKIQAKKSVVLESRRQKNMTCAAPSEDDRTFLIVGGGPTAAACSETLRQEGFKGQIIMTTKEKYLPYDRPKLSKALTVKPADVALRSADFYSVYDIEVQMEKEVTSVDTLLNTVTFKDDSTQSYDKLLLATGATPRQLTFLPGHDLGNIVTLRTVDDANNLAASAAGKDVVIIGTSFIGVEVAAALSDKASSITIVDRVKAPFQLALGLEVGTALKQLLEEKGVKFAFEITPKEFTGEGGVVRGVLLDDGRCLKADLCVVGIGVAPATGFLNKEELAMSEHGFVIVDKYLQTSKDNVYAGGDIAFFPYFLADDKKVNVQHWQMAHKHGQVAALNMLGKHTAIRSVPYFWTVLYGKSLRYTGYGMGYDDIIIHGSLDDLKFIAYYTKGDHVVAVASLNYDPVVSQAADYMLTGKKITKKQIQEDALGWTSKI